MSARDELAGVLAGVVNGPKDGTSITRRMADAALAAGYRKPRVIATQKELAEAHMVVVRTSAGTIANLMSGRAYVFGYEASAPVDTLAIPVTVLWERGVQK